MTDVLGAGCPACGTPAAGGATFCRSCGTRLGAPVSDETVAATVAPGLGTATEEMAGRACPYCNFRFKPGVDVVTCGGCHAVHHSECYGENVGCAVTGCVNGPGSPAGALVAQQTQQHVASAPVAPPDVTIGVTRSERTPPAPQPLPDGGGAFPWKLLAIAVTVVAVVAIGAASAILLTGDSRETAVADADRSGAVRSTGTDKPEPTPTEEPEPSPTEEPEPDPTEEPDPEPTEEPDIDLPDEPDPEPAGEELDSDPAPPPATTSTTAGPATVLRRHYAALNAGDYARAHSLMAPDLQSPNWIAERSAARPAINIISIETLPSSGSSAAVAVDMYARDTVDTRASDTKCRHFVGEATMVKSSGRWRYAARDFDATVADDDPSCP